VNAFRRHIKLEHAFGVFRDDCFLDVGLSPSTRRQAEDEMNRSAEPEEAKVAAAPLTGPLIRSNVSGS